MAWQRGEKLAGNLSPENISKGNYDQILLFDLCRLCVSEEDFCDALIEKKGKVALSDYRAASGAKVLIEEVIKEMAFELFREVTFKAWRTENEKQFLKEKRKEEKRAKSYQKPYIDYLDSQETAQFKQFWDRYGPQLFVTFLLGSRSNEEALKIYEDHLAAWHSELLEGAHSAIFWRPAYLVLQQALQGLDPEFAKSYLKTMRGFKDLNQPLLGRYRHLRTEKNSSTVQNILPPLFIRSEDLAMAASDIPASGSSRVDL